MADIRVTSTGKPFYKVDDTLAAILIEALPSVFERVKAPAPEPLPTRPAFRLAAGDQGRWGIRCTYPSGETRMLIPALYPNGGMPTREAAALYFGNIVWDPTAGTEGKQVQKPLPVPDDIWKQFLSAYGA
jgi:hypothetical protein